MHEDARRLDTLSLSAEAVACALAAFEVLDRAGWPAIHERARLLAGALAEQLDAPGVRSPSAHQTRATPPRSSRSRAPIHSPSASGLPQRGVLLRDIPGRPWLRASVGAWNDEHDLARLLDALDG